MSVADDIRSRMKHTAARIRHITQVKAALKHLQAKRREQLAAFDKPTIMFDSITLDQIPASAPAVAGYVGGRWPTYSQLAARFPKARLLSIAVTASENAECLDVEPGDALPAQAPAWVKAQIARGVRRPVVYTSVSQAQALVDRLAAAGIKRGQFRLWTAHYTMRQHICGPQCGFGMRGTADATQWTDKALGRNLDQSQCGPGFWS